MQKITFGREDKLNFEASEAFKTLRTNITFCGDEVRVVMLTSSLPNEGKSSTAINLARSFGQNGNKTLLIDTDIRNSIVMSRYMVQHKVEGLTNYLVKKAELDDIIYETSYENMDVIFTGPVSPNPVELLGSDTFTKMIQTLRGRYEYIIIDTPPLGEVIDAAVIAKNVDGAILVVESAAISYKLAQSVKEQLDKSGCRILGAVLSKVESSSKSGHGKYGYGYGKHYGYGKEPSDKEKA